MGIDTESTITPGDRLVDAIQWASTPFGKASGDGASGEQVYAELQGRLGLYTVRRSRLGPEEVFHERIILDGGRAFRIGSFTGDDSCDPEYNALCAEIAAGKPALERGVPVEDVFPEAVPLEPEEYEELVDLFLPDAPEAPAG